jgi:hypothetical protein
MALKGRRFNDITWIQSKARDVFGEFQTMHCRKCLEQGHIHWACSTKSQRDYCEISGFCHNVLRVFAL